MPDILQYTDYDSGNAALPILYSDGAADPGSIVVADFLDPTGYANNTIPAALVTNNTLRNFANDLFEISAGSNPPAPPAGGNIGLIYDRAGVNMQIVMPTTAKMPANKTLFGFGAWIKPYAMTVQAGVFGSVLGYTVNTNASGCQYAIQCITQTDPTKYILLTSGPGAQVTVNANEVAQIFGVVSISGTAISVTGYKNGIAVVTGSGTLSGGALPLPASGAIIGNAGGFTPGAWHGEIGRVIIQDFTISGAQTPDAFIANDFALNRSRFGL